MPGAQRLPSLGEKSKSTVLIRSNSDVALDDDQKLRWALQMLPSVSFYCYPVSFKLIRH